MVRKKNNRILTVYMLLGILLGQNISSTHSFFLNRFFNRRQVNQPQVQSLSSSRGQVGEGFNPQQQTNIRIVNRPHHFVQDGSYRSNENEASSNTNTQVSPGNFFVPKELCDACGKLGWTPVAGAERIRPKIPEVVDNSIQYEQGPSQQQTQSVSFPQPQPPFGPYQVQHLEVTKEPGNTVVINALGPYPQSPPENNRKPFAFQFGNAPQNSFTQHGQKNNAEGNNNFQQQPQHYTVPIQSEPQREQTLTNNQQSGYTGGPINYPDSAPQNGYAGNGNKLPVPEPPVYFVNTNQPPNQHPTHSTFQKQNQSPGINPLTVGTIVAAQQNLNVHDIQPAKLVYQEHTHIFPQSQAQPYHPPPPPRNPITNQGPHSQYGKASPHSFKLPIVSRPMGVNMPFGTVTINQVPLHAVPGHKPYQMNQNVHVNNYGKPPVPPPSSYGSPAPFPPPQYRPAVHPQQQNFPYPHYRPFMGPPSNFEQNRPNYAPVALVPVPQHSSPNMQAYNPVPLNPVPNFQSYEPYQRPPIPGRPYTQPQATPQNEYNSNMPPIPEKEMRPPGGDLYLPPNNPFRQPSFETVVENAIDTPQEDPRANTQSNVAFPEPQATIEYGPSTPSPKPSAIPTNNNFFIAQDYPSQINVGQEVQEGYGEPEVRQQSQGSITIPGLFQLQPYDQPLGYGPQVNPFQHEFVVPVGQKGIVTTAAEYAQPSINAQVHEVKPDNFDSAKASPNESSDEFKFVKNSHIQYLDPTTENETKGNGESNIPTTTEPVVQQQTGLYEIIPATQYDITHLFTKPTPQVVSKDEGNNNAFPIPIPVPVSETDVANSNAPVFVVSPGRGEERKVVSNQPIIHQLPSVVAHSNGQKSSNHQYSYQAHFDELPPSVFSALHHAQRTSFLTHQHLTPTAPSKGKENTVYVNSISVKDASNTFFPEPPPGYGNIPYAIDLNSGKPLSLHQEVDPDTKSLKTVIEADGESHRFEENHSEQASVISSVTAPDSGNSGDQDQTAVNCNNNQQWVYPIPSHNIQVEKESESSQHLVKAQDSNHVQENYYYPQTLPSSVYYLERPVAVNSFTQGRFGDKIRPDSSEKYVNVKSSDNYLLNAEYDKPQILSWSKIIRPSDNSNVVHAKLSSSYSRPAFNVEDLGKNSDSQDPFLSSEIPFHAENVKSGSQAELSTEEPGNQSTVPTTKVYHLHEQASENDKYTVVKPQGFHSSSHIINLLSPQGIVKSKSSKIVDETFSGIDGTASGNINEIVGPTTIAECVTESTTEYTIPTSFATDTTDGTTINSVIQTTESTFSPRIPSSHEKVRIRLGSRFPNGRPTIGSPNSNKVTLDNSPGQASINIPVYRVGSSSTSKSVATTTPRPFHPSKLLSIHPLNAVESLEDIYKSSEVSQLGSASTETVTSTFGTDLPLSSTLDTQEDDEADEEQVSGSSSKSKSTGRKVPSGYSAHTTQDQDKYVSSTVTEDFLSPTTEATGTTSTSTKVIKTVRVRQRMRPGTYFSSTTRNNSLLSRNRGGIIGSPSRVRVIQRPATQEYIKSFPEFATPEGETLGEDEQKEVKSAMFEIKKI